MKNILNIVKKEMDKIFKYPRMIFTTLIMPGLLIFLMYTFMGTSASSMSKEANKASKILVVHPSEEFTSVIINSDIESAFNVDFLPLADDHSVVFNLNDYMDDLESGDINAVILFSLTDDKEVTVYSDLSLDSNSLISDKIESIFMYYSLEMQEAQPNLFNYTGINNVNEKGTQALMVATILPYMMIIFIFSGSLSIGSDSIAGEKERGTLATILITPIKKREFVVGKLVSATILGVLGAISSFVGILLSFMTGGSMFKGVNISYSFVDYLLIFIVLLSLALFAVSLILVASAYAKSVKEANMLAMPFYIIATIIGVLGMFGTHVTTDIQYYLIPIYNINLCLKSIFMFEINITNMLVTIGSTLAYSAILIVVILKMFKNENILFGK